MFNYFSNDLCLFECSSVYSDFLTLVYLKLVLLNDIKYILKMLNNFKNIYTKSF